MKMSLGGGVVVGDGEGDGVCDWAAAQIPKIIEAANATLLAQSFMVRIVAFRIARREGSIKTRPPRVSPPPLARAALSV